MANAIKRSVGILILVVAIFFSYRDFSNLLPQVPGVLASASVWFILLVLLMQVVSYCASAGTTHFLLALKGKRIRFADNLRVSIGAEFGANVLPIAGGPLASYLGFINLGIDKLTARYVVSVETIFLVTNYITWFLISLILPPYPRLIGTLPGLPAKLAGGLSVILLVCYLARRQIIAFVKDAIYHAKIIAQRPLITFAIFMFTSTYFFIDVAMLLVAFFAFGYKIKLGLTVFCFLSSSFFLLITATSTVPGVMEGSLALLFIQFGVPAHIAISAAILYRLLTFWIWIPLSILYSYRNIKSAVLD